MYAGTSCIQSSIHEVPGYTFVFHVLNLFNEVSCVTMQDPFKDLGLAVVK